MLGIEGEGISYNNKILMIPSGNLTWLFKMAIEMVDLPIKDCDFPVPCVSLHLVYQRVMGIEWEYTGDIWWCIWINSWKKSYERLIPNN